MQIVEQMDSNHRACFRMQFSYKFHVDKHAARHDCGRLYASLPRCGFRS